jgi:hypothetical protein
MKRSDNIFFFTLIDFLLQVGFFGLLLFAAYSAAKTEDKKEQTANETSFTKLKKHFGISNITELTNELTKLAPLQELKGNADFIAREGGVKQIEQQLAAIRSVGSVEHIKVKLEKLAKLEGGTGKPPCLPVKPGSNQHKALATVIADENTIAFESLTDDLRSVLQLVSMRYEDVRTLPVSAFAARFAVLSAAKPDCRYSLIFKEKTRFVEPRDAASRNFYLMIRKVGA